MKRINFLFALIILVTVNSFAQDTTLVQTLTFDSITTRRGIFDFPDNSHEYRKILMSYTLKCDAATTQDNLPCGEWDYLTYSFIYDHTGVMDSTLIEHPYFMIGVEAPDTASILNSPVYNYYQNNQYSIVYDIITSEDEYAIGSGTEISDNPFGVSNSISRTQYMWTESELTTVGLTAGNIDKIKFDVNQLGGDINNLKIRIKSSGNSELTEFKDDGFTEVYHQNTTFASTGINNFEFTAPYLWDGTSNIIAEFSYSNQETGTDNIINAADVGFISTVNSKGNDGYVSFSDGNYIDIPVTGYDFGSEITISFWTFGDPDHQPENNCAFEAYDANNKRVLNSHLTWSNERVYWDAGEGDGYDRIDKAATSEEYEGQWNHWAFTKNATSGEMKIYLNGELWHSGTGLTRVIGEVEKFRLGRGFCCEPYNGNVDEFRVWDVELDQVEISSWILQF